MGKAIKVLKIIGVASTAMAVVSFFAAKAKEAETE